MSEIQEIEHYILNQLSAEDHLLMEAKLLLNKELSEKEFWQRQTYALAKLYGRKKLKAEIEAVHARLFTEKKFESFRQKISFIFKRKL